VLFLAALLVLVLVLVFWAKMLLSFSHILVTYKLSQVLVEENTKGFFFLLKLYKFFYSILVKETKK